MSNHLVIKLYIAAILGVAIIPSVLAGPLTIDSIRESGEITGKALYCNDQNLSQGISVQIPGKSFQANTDSTGSFTLSYVPIGTYSLTFSKHGHIFDTKIGIEVFKRTLTDIGLNSFCPDLDNDGILPPIDCNNQNASVYPGAPELCGDGNDNNCNGETDESCPSCSDADNDTFYAQIGCGIVDCNDENNAINPNAKEICDGIDNNCNGRIDEAGADGASAYYPDNDKDGFGDNSQELITCMPPNDYISVGGDCDDSIANVNPAAPEFCNNGLDDDCDGFVDEVDANGGCSNAVCSEQELIALQENCTNSSSLLSGCISNSNLSANCDQAVNNLLTCAASNAYACLTDGSISFDDALACVYYTQGSPCQLELEQVLGNYVPGECVPGSTQACGSSVGECTQGQRICSDYATWGSCNGGIRPTDEICDNKDNDCDGTIDNSCVACTDNDGDGFYTSLECPYSNGDLDCNDANSNINPGAPEVCGDAIDNNCDGQIDETCPVDTDGDGFDITQDCNDNDFSIYPGAPEQCDSLDNDCNGIVDDNPINGETYYRDEDGDGFGDPSNTIQSCQPPSGYIYPTPPDCDDANASINLSAIEICGDGIDQNCDGVDSTCP